MTVACGIVHDIAVLMTLGQFLQARQSFMSDDFVLIALGRFFFGHRLDSRLVSIRVPPQATV